MPKSFTHFRFPLPDLGATKKIGAWLATAILECTDQHTLFPVLLTGKMGSGKTTLVRYVIQELPGGEGAEVSSPSFTICNIYPTLPPVWHCDLYKLGNHMQDEDIETALDGQGRAIFLEWGNWLPDTLVPLHRVEITWSLFPESRIIDVFFYNRFRSLSSSLQKFLSLTATQ